MRRRIGLFAAVSLLVGGVTLSATPAGAITNGEPDGAGHPYVGILVAEHFTPGVKQRFCSGTLVAPRIVVSAAHCLELVESFGIAADQIWVSFDPVYDQALSTLYHGTMVADPEFWSPGVGHSRQYGFSDAHDIAVVHLDEAPPITPARLPTAELLSSSDLSGQTFTAVGYGRTRVDKTGGPNSIQPNLFPSVRNVATQEFRSLQSHWVTMSQNPSTGSGGWCYGDSGGANFLGDSNLAVSLSDWIDSQCRSLARGYRLDIDSARTFLASQGVPLP